MPTWISNGSSAGKINAHAPQSNSKRFYQIPITVPVPSSKNTTKNYRYTANATGRLLTWLKQICFKGAEEVFYF